MSIPSGEPGWAADTRRLEGEAWIVAGVDLAYGPFPDRSAAERAEAQLGWKPYDWSRTIPIHPPTEMPAARQPFAVNEQVMVRWGSHEYMGSVIAVDGAVLTVAGTRVVTRDGTDVPVEVHESWCRAPRLAWQ